MRFSYFKFVRDETKNLPLTHKCSWYVDKRLKREIKMPLYGIFQIQEIHSMSANLRKLLKNILLHLKL